MGWKVREDVENRGEDLRPTLLIPTPTPPPATTFPTLRARFLPPPGMDASSPFVHPPAQHLSPACKQQVQTVVYLHAKCAYIHPPYLAYMLIYLYLLYKVDWMKRLLGWKYEFVASLVCNGFV